LLQLARQATVVDDRGRVHPIGLHDAALLAWLALEGPTPRSRLVTLLWPDKDGEAARNSLRQRLFRLRRDLGGDVVVGDLTLALGADVRHDLGDADSVLGDAQPRFGPEFGSWLAQQRQRRVQRVRRSLAELAEMAERAGDWDDAIAHAGELIALEPLSEEAHRRLMRLHYLRGDRAAALLAFDRCEQVLKNEVGATPSPETLALLGTIEAAAPAVVAAANGPVPASVLRPPRLVGRARELAALEQGWNGGMVVALMGEAGMGKTRLLQSFAEGRPGIVRSAGRPGDAGVPFATLARLLRAVLPPGDPAAAMPAAARRELARVLPEFGDTLPERTGEGRRLVLQRALNGLLAGRAGLEGLIVDDLHFADEASLEMLGALVDESAGTLRWSFAYRPAEAGTPLRALHDALVEQVRLVAVALEPLAEAELAELVDSLGLPGIDGRALAAGLRQRTGGNPLFVLETLKQAWAERTLAELADARRLPRPLSVSRLIERRIASISAGALALARVASIAGVDFSIELAEHVLQADAMRFADALNELEAAQVMRGTMFAHDLVHDAVRASVPEAIARLTHARVAAWLEPRGGEPARIARHWIDAGRPAQALPWLGKAAERAGAAVRRREHVAFLELKGRIEEETGERRSAFETLMEAAEIEVTLDDGARAGVALCDRLDALAADAEQRVRAATQRSNLATMRGFLDEAEAVAAQALGLALREGVSDTTMAQCRIALGTALSSQERPAEALVHFEAALGWVRGHASEALRCEFHGNLATTYDRLCRFDDGLAHHREATRLAQGQDHHGNWAVTLSNMASNRTRAGAFADADALLEQARLVHARAAEPSAIVGYIAIEHAVVHRQRGRYARALRCIDEGLDNLRRYAPGYVPMLLAQRAACWAHLGQWARLEHEIEAIERDSVPARTAVRLAMLRREADIALGRPARDASLEQAGATIEAGSAADFRHVLQVWLAAGQADADGLARLEAIAVEALRLGHAMTQLPAHAHAATLALALGERERALGHARAAWRLADAVGPTMSYPLAPWLHCAQVFDAVGETAAAIAACTRAGAWIAAALEAEVAAEFRASFLERNPVNRDFRALAARLGLPSA
jgi:DNA-binding SARP family transcriptional activator